MRSIASVKIVLPQHQSSSPRNESLNKELVVVSLVCSLTHREGLWLVIGGTSANMPTQSKRLTYHCSKCSCELSNKKIV